MELMYEAIFDSGTADHTYSLRKQRYIEIDGIRQDIGQPERVAVVPGDFDIVKSFAPELLETFEALWTPEVIGKWEDGVADCLAG